MRALLSRLKNEKESFIKRHKDRLKESVIFDAVPESIQTSISKTLIDAISASLEKKDSSPLIATLNTLHTNKEYPVSAKLFLEVFHLLEDTVMSDTRNVASAKLVWRLCMDAREMLFEEAMKEKSGGQAVPILDEDQKELKRTASIQRATIEALPDGILVVDKTGAILIYNKKFLEIWGIPDEIATTQDDKGLIEFCKKKLDKPQIFVERIKEISNKLEKPSEDLLELRDGRIFHRSSRPHLFDDEIIGRLWCFRDVTEQKRASMALEASEKRFRDLAELFPELIFELNTEGRITYSNKTGFDLFGYTQEDFYRGVSAYDCFVPEDHESLRENLANALRRGKTDGDEYRARRKDGSVFPVVTYTSPIYEMDEHVGYRGIMIDISSRKKMEEALRQREQQFREVAANIPGAVFQFYARDDGSWGANYISERTEEMFGIGPLSEGYFERFTQLVLPEYRDGFLSSIKNAVDEIKDWMYEGKLQKPSGEIIWFRGHSTPHRRDIEIVFNGVLLDVTEQKEAEDALRKNERIYRSVIENIQDVFCRSDTDGRISMISPSGVELFGFNALSEMIGLSVESLWVDPSKRQGALDIIRAKGRVKDFETVLKRKDGTAFHAAISFHFYRDDAGNVLGTEGIIRDITERKWADEELQEGKAILESLINATRETLLLADTEGNILVANETVAQRFGNTVREYIGTNMYDSFPPDLAASRKAQYDRVIRTGEPAHFQDERIGRTFDIYAYPVFDAAGQVTRLAIFAMDITERKQAEEALRESKAILESLINATRETLLLVDTEGNILVANKTVAQRFGKTREELINVCHLDFFPPDLAASRKAQYDRAVGTGKPVYFRDQRNGRSYDHSIYPVFDAAGQVTRLAIFAMDITERELAEEALKESEKKYRQVVDNAHEIIIIAQDGFIKYANPRLFEIIGLQKDVCTRPFIEFIYEEDRQIVIERHRARLRGENPPDQYQFRIFDKDGNLRWLQIVSTVIRCQERPATLNFIEDITNRKKSEMALREREAKLNSIFLAAPVGITIVTERIFEEINDSFCTMVDYTREELLNKNARMLYKTDDEYNKVGQIFYENVSGTEVCMAETHFLRKDGTAIDVMLRGVPLDPSDLSKGMTFAALDITEQKRVEKTIRESQERYHRLVETSPDSIVMYDTNGDLITVNQKTADLYGVESPEQFLAEVKNVLCILSKEDYLKAVRSLRETAVTGKSVTSEYSIICKNGSELPVEINSSLVNGADGKPKAFISVVRDITERKQAEVALYESESKFRDLVEKSIAGVYIIQDGIFQYVNTSAATMMGYETNEIIGKMTPMDTTLPEDWPVVKESINKRLSGESDSSHYEFRIKRKNGDVKTIEVFSSRTVHKGKPAVIGTMLDITERKQSENRIVESEQALRAILSASPIGIGRIRDRIFEWVNESMCHITGYSFEELIGKNTRFLYPEDEDYRITGEILYKEGQFETRWMTRDGLLKDIFLQIAQTSSTSFIVTASDITEIKKAQNDLSVSESRLRAIIDSAQDAIYIKDQAWCYIVANPAMGKLFGMSPDEILGKRDADLFEEDSGNHIEEIDKKVLAGEIVMEQSERDIQGSKHIFDMIKVPLYNKKSTIIGLCGIARDITERKNLEFQLAQSQKIEAIGTLAGGVAHDFNNIIGAIMGYASLLQLKMDHTDEKSNYVAQILSASEKAANLTQSLLAFSRKQLIRLKPVRINEVIEHIQKILARLLTEDIESRTELSNEDLAVLADEGQIDQVIMNLVTNARDAMPRGGSLTITTSPFTIGDEFIRTRGFGKKGQYACISVADTGKGIDANIRAKIFEPFFTTKEVGKGTGLGLSLVYGIVKQHNGFIEVDSKITQGTTFHVYLPLTQDAAGTEGLNVSNLKIAGGTETILVAEDNVELANVVKTVLSDNGYKVIMAKDGLEALSLFKENRIDLAILDVVMPKKNGWEVYEGLKEIDSHSKVLFVSGYTDDIIQEKGLTQEGIDLVLKPLSPNHLLGKVREILDRKS